MAYTTIRLKRGLKKNLPTLLEGEMAFCTDTKELYVGSTSGNVLISSGSGVGGSVFANIKVGATTIIADSNNDTFELVAGSGIILTPDTTNDKITIKTDEVSYVGKSTFTYDPVSGYVSSITTPSSTITYTYLNDRIATEKEVVTGGKTITKTFSYDTNGILTNIDISEG